MSEAARRVILLCGPPGSGKSTIARTSGLPVYDRDEKKWAGEGHFVREIEKLRGDPTAQAVVIRAAATSHQRAHWAWRIGATHVWLVDTPRDECARRITQRGRPTTRGELGGLTQWFRDHDRTDNVQPFPGTWPWKRRRSRDWAPPTPPGL